MPFFAALSTNSDTGKAIDEVCAGASDALQGPADLALIFFSPQHANGVARQAGELQKRLGANCLLGCSGASIVGHDQEVEQAPAISVWLARWEKAMRTEPFYLTYEKTPSGETIMGLPDSIAEADPRQSAVLLLGDPLSFRTNVFLQLMNERFKGLRVMGGMASGGHAPGQCKLLVGDTMRHSGAVGVLLSGSVPVRCIVSQGCRPIGKHFVITKAKGNIIRELDDRPPLDQVQQLWLELSPRDQQLCHGGGLLIARVINEGGDKSGSAGYLVRTVLDLDRGSGALTVNDRIAVGQTVQFHVRDADSADEDLRLLLQTELPAHGQKPGGALLFTCNLRGSRLFSRPHHDAGALRAEAGNIPVAGCFVQGEIGPVGGQNFVHGATATVVFFGD
jgi:small ligand-binding sensory domain FIST